MLYKIYIEDLWEKIVVKEGKLPPPEIIASEFECEGEKFSVTDFSVAFSARNEETLRIVALNNCGGLPYPIFRPKYLVNIFRKIFYNKQEYKDMIGRYKKNI